MECCSFITLSLFAHVVLIVGTGKTSTIVAAAKRMYGDAAYSSMTLELNASDSRGIDVRKTCDCFILLFC